MARGRREERRGGGSASFWWSVDAHRLESLPSPTTMTDQPTRCQHMFLAVICSNSTQPPGSASSTYQGELPRPFFPEGSSMNHVPVLAREKDTDAAIPRGPNCHPKIDPPPASATVFQATPPSREAPIRTIVPSNKHSPTEILAACRFTGPWMRGCSCECWVLSWPGRLAFFYDGFHHSFGFPPRTTKRPNEVRACPREGGLGRATGRADTSD